MVEKRKHAENGSSKSRKKTHIVPVPAPQAQTLKVSSVRTVECPPIVAASPGLVIPPATEFQVYEKELPPKSKRAQNQAEILLQSSAHPRMEYTAREDADPYLKHYLGIFDPKTGQLEVIEAKKMTVRGVAKSQKESIERATHRDAGKTMTEQRTALGEAFGTKKARKAIESIRENAITRQGPDNLDSTSQAIMNELKESTKDMATREELQDAINGSIPGPKPNREATEIQDVYKAEDLIGADVLKSIPVKDWQEAAKKRTGLKLPYRFASGIFLQVADGPNSTQRLRVLRYLVLVLEFLRSCKPGKARGSLKVPLSAALAEALKPAPQPVIDSIRRRFSDKGEVNKIHKQNAYTTLCVLAAILANYEFDTQPLLIDMGLDEKDFAQYFKSIGGRITTPVAKDTKVKMQYAKLSLPLAPPPVRGGYRAPRR